MDWRYPTEENQVDLEATYERLRTAGIPPGLAGYDVVTLTRAIEARDWRWDVGSTPPGATAPYHATVEGVEGPSQAGAYYALGWSVAVALARALDRMLQGT